MRLMIAKVVESKIRIKIKGGSRCSRFFSDPVDPVWGGGYGG